MQTSGDSKDYGQDLAKRQVRRLFREFIEDGLSRSSFRGTKILCLPGAELHEVNEIHSLLPGVGENRLTLVERNALNARLMKASMPNAEVVPGELQAFVEKTPEKFDVVSLDFCSAFGPQISEILLTIRERELLADRGVVLVCAQAKRENARSKRLLASALELAALHRSPGESAESAMYGNTVGEELADRGLSAFRGDAFSHWLSCTFLGGADSVYAEWVAAQDSQALLARIEEKALRRWAVLRMRQWAPGALAALDLPGERVQGDVVDCFGVHVPKAGTVTNEYVEAARKTFLEGRIEIIDGDTSEIDVARRVWRLAEDRRKRWAKLLWWGVLPAEEDDWAKRDNALSGMLPPRGKTGEDRPDGVLRLRFVLRNLFKQALLDLFVKDLKEPVRVHGGWLGYPQNMGGLVFEYTMGALGKPYWITRHARYRYVSDSGCPMLVDMLAVDRTWLYRDLVRVDESGKIVPNVPQKLRENGDLRKVRKYLDEQLDDIRTFAKALAGESGHYGAGAGSWPSASSAA